VGPGWNHHHGKGRPLAEGGVITGHYVLNYELKLNIPALESAADDVASCVRVEGTQ
jgi:hypothetical protein